MGEHEDIITSLHNNVPQLKAVCENDIRPAEYF